MGHDGVRRRISAFAALGSALILSLSLLSSAGVHAQGEEGGHPAHIHSGSCNELGDVIYPLSNVGPGGTLNGTSQPSEDPIGAEDDIYPVDFSVTTVDASLSDIADGNTAINVHESTDEIQNYIACGNIGGPVIGGMLVIGLETLNDSHYSGVAVLTDKDDQTEVTVYLGEGLEGDDHGGDDEADDSGNGSDDDNGDDDRGGESTPSASSDSTTEGSAVEIADFAYGPESLEIAAGTEVTWTNNDSTAHTVTADDGSFDSGKIDEGGTFSFTFDTPGTYAYHCDFHPNMTATIVVS